MAQTIKLKRSATSGATPTTSQLELGEVAINTYDGKMFIKKNDGSDAIVEIGATATSATSAQEVSQTFTANGDISAGSPVSLRSDGKVEVVGAGQNIAAATGTFLEHINQDATSPNGKMQASGRIQVAYDGSQYAVVLTCNDDEGDTPNYRVFSVSGTTLTAVGSGTVEYLDVNADYPPAICYDSSLSKFLVYGKGKPSGQSGNGHLAHISLDSNGAATVSLEYNASTQTVVSGPDLIGLGGGRAVLVHTNASQHLCAQVISSDGTNFTLGTVLTVDNQGQNKPIYSKAYNGKVIVIYRSGGTVDDLKAVVLDPGTSGTTVTAGTPVEIEDYDPGSHAFAADVSNTGQLCIFGSTNAVAYGSRSIWVGSVSGTGFTSFTQTDHVVPSNSNTNYGDMTWDDTLGKFIWSYRDNTSLYPQRRIVTINSSTLAASVGDAVQLNNVSQHNFRHTVISLGSGKYLYAYYQNAGSSFSRSAYLGLRQEAITVPGGPVADYIGINKTAVTDGNTATIINAGTAPASSSLTQGSTYYLTTAGAFTTTDTGYGPIGKAITTSSLVLDSLGVRPNRFEITSTTPTDGTGKPVGYVWYVV